MQHDMRQPLLVFAVSFTPEMSNFGTFWNSDLFPICILSPSYFVSEINVTYLYIRKYTPECTKLYNYFNISWGTPNPVALPIS